MRDSTCPRAQTLMKGRLKGAQTGHNLLKKKADALAIRFRMILKKIIDVSENRTAMNNDEHRIPSRPRCSWAK